jgi:hypothetical protein
MIGVEPTTMTHVLQTIVVNSNRTINKRGNDVPLMKFRELFLKRVVVNQIDIRDVRLDQIHNEPKPSSFKCDGRPQRKTTTTGHYTCNYAS